MKAIPSLVMYGKKFYVALPVPSLYHSETVKSAIERGGCFAFCKETGELTIFSRKRLAAQGFYAKNGKVYSLDAVPAPNFYIAFADGAKRQLPSNFKKALEELEAMEPISLVQAVIYSNTSAKPVSMRAFETLAMQRNRIEFHYNEAYRAWRPWEVSKTQRGW